MSTSSQLRSSLFLNPRTRSIVILYAAYYVDNALIGLGELDMLACAFENATKIVVANCRDTFNVLNQYTHSGWIVLEGSNFHHEFSAWQEGLSHYLCYAHAAADFFVFANDTVARPNGNIHAAHINKLRVLMSRQRPCCALGLVHSSLPINSCMSINGYNASPWISSGLFALGSQIIKLLEYKVNYIDKISHLLKEEPSGRDLFTEDIDPNLENHIQSWLFDGFAGGWNKSHHSSDILTNREVLKHKAMMILAEKFLSIKIRQANAKILAL